MAQFFPFNPSSAIIKSWSESQIKLTWTCTHQPLNSSAPKSSYQMKRKWCFLWWDLSTLPICKKLSCHRLLILWKKKLIYKASMFIWWLSAVVVGGCRRRRESGSQSPFLFALNLGDQMLRWSATTTLSSDLFRLPNLSYSFAELAVIEDRSHNPWIARRMLYWLKELPSNMKPPLKLISKFEINGKK